MSYLNLWSPKKKPIEEPKIFLLKYFHHEEKICNERSEHLIWYLAILVCIIVAVATIFYLKKRRSSRGGIRSMNELNQN